MNFKRFQPQHHLEKGEFKMYAGEREGLTEILRVANLLEGLVVGLVAHLDVFPNIDDLGSHVELLVAHALDVSQEFILKAAINPSFDRDVIGDGLGEGAKCAPAEEEEDSPGAVDNSGISVVDKHVCNIEDGNEDANQAAEELYRFVKHAGRWCAVF